MISFNSGDVMRLEDLVWAVNHSNFIIALLKNRYFNLVESMKLVVDSPEFDFHNDSFNRRTLELFTSSFLDTL